MLEIDILYRVEHVQTAQLFFPTKSTVHRSDWNNYPVEGRRIKPEITSLDKPVVYVKDAI